MRPKAWEQKLRIFTQHPKAWELPGHTGLYSQDGKNTIFLTTFYVFFDAHANTVKPGEKHAFETNLQEPK